MIIWGFIGLAVVCLTARALWFEPRSLTITHLDVQTPSWPQGTQTLRAVLISDIHIDGLHMPPERVFQMAQRINRLEPDVILLAGDYIGGDYWQTGPHMGLRTRRTDADNALQEEGLKALDALNAPLGVYAVMGNHDCWWDCARVRETLAKTHIKVLENQAFRLPRLRGDVWIIGLEDGQTQAPNFQSASAKVPRGAASIVLAHNPGLFDWPTNSWAIQLSGHTHAGQVRFPIVGAPVRASRHTEDTADGWTIEGGRILIVTRGLGESGLPIRLGATPQIMLLTLRPGEKAEVQPVKSLSLHD